MNPRGKFCGNDWVIATVLILLGLVLYAPFRSRFAYHWDSAEFSLAVRDYSVALSQPHPPGYFLYVMFGRLVNGFVGDPHASLVWMSVVAGSGVAAAMYLLGTAMFGRRTGIAAALFAMTSPLIWFHSCIALTYVVDAFLVCVMVLWCWRVIERAGSWKDAAIIGGLLAVIGGVRQQTVPELLPLVIFTCLKFEVRPVAKLVLAGGVSIMGALAWLVPMVRLSGGISPYWQSVQRFSEFVAQKEPVGTGWDAFLWSVFFSGAFWWNGLLLGTVVLAGGLGYRAFWMNPERKRMWDCKNAGALRVLALWIVTMVLFGTVINFTDAAGHILSYLPALLLLTAVVVAQLRKSLFIGVTVAVCVINAEVFLAGARPWDGALFHMSLQAQKIREHDERLEQAVKAVRSAYRPSEVVICHARGDFFFGMRHFQLYLCEFEQYQIAKDRAMVVPSDRPMLSVRGGRLEFVARVETAGKRTALLVVPPGQSLNQFASYWDIGRAQPVSGSGGILYALPIGRSLDGAL